MNSTSRKFHRVALAVLAAAAFLSQAEAAPVVSVAPVAQDVADGASGSVDVIVSGLTEALGAFEFDLTWTAGYLSGAMFGANLAGGLMGPLPLDLSGGVTGNSANAFVAADDTIDAVALFALQGSSFILGTLTFTAGPSLGLTPLILSSVNLSNFTGSTTIGGVTTRNGSVCVGGNCTNQIPEPTTPLLVMAALGALALSRKSRQG